MSHDTTFPRQMTLPVARPSSGTARPGPARTAILAVTVGLAAAAWKVAQRPPYTPGSPLGYGLGVAGGALMLVLVLYALRKHVRLLRAWGPLRYWFRAHMICGILGPLTILFHSTLHVRSLNAAVVMGSTLLVTVSGLMGRFIYRRIHHGLYGSRATLRGLEQELETRLAALDPLLRWLPPVREAIDGFSQRVGATPADWPRRAVHFVTLGWQRHRTARRIGRLMAGGEPGRAGAGPVELAALRRTIDATLHAAQRTAQFTTYERLFSLWHVLHVPVVFMLVITAILHVVAVHMY